MPKTKFFVNTAMVCYNCYRTAVVRLRQSWRKVTLVGNDTEVLDIVFVSCTTCHQLSHVHSPMTALFPKYVDPGKYQLTTNSLANVFNCSPSISQENHVSITSLSIKKLTRIFDPLEVFNISEIPECCIIIIENATQTCHFFGKQTGRNGSPLLAWKARFAIFGPMASRMPVQITLADLWTGAITDDVPPPYSSECAEEL